MKRRIMQGLLLFAGGGVIAFFLYDIVVLKLTNIYKKKLCVEEYCIQKPNDWLPLMVKKSGNSYLYGEFLDNNMKIGKKYLANERNGIVLTKDNAEIVLYEYVEKKKTKSKLLTKKVINGETYFIMNNGSLVVVLFPKLNMSFTIASALNPESLVEHLILTSEKN